jgi:hypothetical protein
MRRLPIALASLSAVAVIASLVTAPAAQAAPAPLSPSVNLKGTTIDRTLFGMHVFNLEDGVFPTVPVGAIRLWDNETTWSAIETGQDQFNWAKLDGAVTTARNNGVTDILMVLAGTPSWGTDDPASGGAAGVLPGAAGMPKNLADWDDWVRQVATRYKGRITAYQPWNEANLVTFSTGTPQEMAQLTKRAYDIIKSIDPAATVVAPSTGTRLGGPFKRFYPAYLRELKALGWPVDVWAAHTYPASLGTPVDRAGLARTFQSVLAAEGAPDLPIWDTENNFGLAGPGAENPDQDIVDRRAADWTARTYLDSLRLGISRVYWYAWGPENDLVGIQMNTGSPAAKAYATLQDWIVGARFNGCSPASRSDVTCRFAKDGKVFRIVYPEVGRATFKTKGFSQVCSLDGTCKPVTKAKIRTFSPVQLRK